MNWLDFVFEFLFLGFAIQGLLQGFSRLVVGLIATVAGLLIASWSYGIPASYLLPYVSSKSLANVLGFLIIFMLVQVVGGLVGTLLAKLFKWSGLGWLDRLLGLVFGGLKAILVGIVIVLILTAFPLKPVPDSVSQSYFAPYLIDAANAFTYVMPRELRDAFAETAGKVRAFWRENVHMSKPKRLETDQN
jgi:membrane protein required for colicin V production